MEGLWGSGGMVGMVRKWRDGEEVEEWWGSGGVVGMVRKWRDGGEVEEWWGQYPTTPPLPH